MKIIAFEDGPVATIGYLVINEDSKTSVLIDVPLMSANKISDTLIDNDITLEAILLTHSHWDHLGDTADLQLLTNVRVYVHKDDEYRLLNPNDHTVFHLPFKIKRVETSNYVSDACVLDLAFFQITVIHTPGHTEGSVCYHFAQYNVLFSGDTLFAESIGRTDLPGGSLSQLLSSIKEKLFTLNDDLLVYPGHGMSTTIGHEKKHNPFLNDLY